MLSVPQIGYVFVNAWLKVRWTLELTNYVDSVRPANRRPRATKFNEELPNTGYGLPGSTKPNHTPTRHRQLSTSTIFAPILARDRRRKAFILRKPRSSPFAIDSDYQMIGTRKSGVLEQPVTF